MKIEQTIQSSDNMATKFIQVTEHGDHVETTYVNYPNKHIICFSTQVGCCCGCTFCANGIANNFKRNLDVTELFAQCMTVIDAMKLPDRSFYTYSDKTPILFSAMGCGEPLLNITNVMKAFEVLHILYPTARFAMATMGTPNFDTMMKEFVSFNSDISRLKLDFKLTVSLHSAIEETRKKLLPNSPKLWELMFMIQDYQKSTIPMRHVDYNVVLFEGINDSEEDAIAIYNMLESRGLLPASTVKLNAYNQVPGCDFKGSNNTDYFARVLRHLGVDVEIYKTNGSDIGGACGQLTAY